MKKRSAPEHIRYWFDCMMSKGPIAMCILLFAVTAAIVGVIGIVAYFFADDGGLLYQLWFSLMYTLDPGNLSGVPTENVPYLMLMFLATLCGLFLTSVLIGVITTGVEGKLTNLRKGTSVVQETGHTVIIGFDDDLYAILRELIEANANKKKARIVILGKQPKEEMEDAISSHIPDSGTTRIICRSGSLHEAYALERCAIENCKSVIINVHDDSETIKILLALSSYIRGKTLFNPELRFIAALEDRQYLEPASIVGEGYAEVIYTKDIIARIISNTCRQHGLSQVLTELFNFSGNEFYFESIPGLAGKTFKEALLSFSNAIAVGLYAEGLVRLNPPMDTVIGKYDQMILLEMDDGDYHYHGVKAVDESNICSGAGIAVQDSDHLLVLGYNEKLPIILAEYAKYVEPGTCVVIVAKDLDEEKLGKCEGLEMKIYPKKITYELLCEFMEDNVKNILLLNDDAQEPEASDSQTLLRLILLRDIADKKGKQFSITTEMRRADNQQLAAQARVDDFVIGTNFTSLLMTQISDNPRLFDVIAELLDEKGSELYMKPASQYVTIGEPIDSYTVTESVARKGEIYVGYRHAGGLKSNVVINPNKNERITFGERDQIVVISAN